MTNYYNSEFDIQGTTGSDESHLKKITYTQELRETNECLAEIALTVLIAR